VTSFGFSTAYGIGSAGLRRLEEVLAQSLDRVPLRILGYTLMGIRWHFVVWPRQRQDEQVTDFFRSPDPHSFAPQARAPRHIGHGPLLPRSL
jgi:hypothetical protein